MMFDIDIIFEANVAIIGIDTVYIILFIIIGYDGSFDFDENRIHCKITEIPENPTIIDAVITENLSDGFINDIPRVISNIPINIGRTISDGIKNSIFEINKSILTCFNRSVIIPINVMYPQTDRVLVTEFEMLFVISSL